MNCVFCDCELEHVSLDDDTSIQPYEGGEVIFEFTYGSAEFDLAPGYTRFHGVVCDSCAKKYVDKMECKLTGFDGEVFGG